MPYLPEVIISLLTAFEVCFTKPTWRHAQILLIGAILCTGKRTVTSCMRVMGLSNEKNFDRYHNVLRNAVWSGLQASKILLGLLIILLPKGFPIIILMDETLERRKGKKIKAKGCYRDSCRSTKSLVIKAFGLKWQCATIIVPMPWSNRHWALPFMTVLCQPNRFADSVLGYKVVMMSKLKQILISGHIGYHKGKMYYINKDGVLTQFPEKLNKQLTKGVNKTNSPGKNCKLIKRNINELGAKNMMLFTELCGQKSIKHKTSIDCAIIMMKKISRWLKRSWILVGDGGFACMKLALECIDNDVTLLSRLRLDAALYELLPDIATKKRGRQAVKGAKVKTLAERTKTPELNWMEQEIAWYKGEIKIVKLLTGINLWYTAGYKPVMIRWVIVQDIKSGRFEAFFSTDIKLSAEKIVEYYVLRWNIECTFQEVRAHLGVETQRQWSDKAINRSTPALMGLFSVVCLIAHKLTNGQSLPVSSTAWYTKANHATFSDVIAYVKQAITTGKYLNRCEINDEFVQIPRAIFDEIVDCGLLVA